MTDFDVLARIRRLEADVERLKAALAEKPRHHDAPEYKRARPIWPEPEEHEAYGAMLHTMSRQRDE